MGFFTLLLYALFPALSFSLTITSSDLSVKASNNAVTDGVLEVWGSTTGACTHDSTSNGTVDTCNSCTGNADKEEPCNLRKISPASNITISFTYDSNLSNTLPFLKQGETDITPESGSTASNGTATIVISWADLCDAMPNDDNTCASIDTADFTFGVADSSDSSQTDSITMKVYTITVLPTDVSPDCSNGTAGTAPYNVGIKDFSAFPGDEKVFFPGQGDADRVAPNSALEFCEATGVNSGNSPTGGEITSLVAFYNTTALADVDTSSDSQTIFFTGTFPDDTSIEEPFIDNFDNETKVFTRLAVQDKAGNIFDLSPTNAQIAAIPVCNGIDSTSSSISDIFACAYTTLTMEVNGLLAEDFNCFIATATFGSSMNFVVEDLREFRNRFLLTNTLGSKFVKGYYNWGSKASHFIVEYKSLKLISRVLLLPVWVFAKLSLLTHVFFTLALMILLLASFTFVFVRQRKKMRAS